MILVLRVFLRRLVDNDVISPNADRHESLAVLFALVVSFAVFVTFLITWGYLAAFIQLPGPTALRALSTSPWWRRHCSMACSSPTGSSR